MCSCVRSLPWEWGSGAVGSGAVGQWAGGQAPPSCRCTVVGLPCTGPSAFFRIQPSASRCLVRGAPLSRPGGGLYSVPWSYLLHSPLASWDWRGIGGHASLLLKGTPSNPEPELPWLCVLEPLASPSLLELSPQPLSPEGPQGGPRRRL